MRRVPVLLALLATVALAGCGGQGSKNTDSSKEFKGEQQEVATTIEDLQTAAKDRNGGQVCSDLITAELRDKISATDCGKVVKDAIRETDEVDLEVTKVTITGDKAVAEINEQVAEDTDRKRTINLEKTAGKWRISQLPQAS